MKKDFKLGLVIQGPVISAGKKSDGPNYIQDFDTIKCLETNINRFSPHVEQIVISTWEDSGLNVKDFRENNIILLKNRQLSIRDQDNRRKQFVSVYEGVKYLVNNSDVTHVMKIRTDQVVDSAIIQWMRETYETAKKDLLDENFFQEDRLLFSDMIKKTPFYAGDFIIGGALSDVVRFCRSVLSYGTVDLHPTAGIDYILKYLTKNDRGFREKIYKCIPLIWQISNPANSILCEYWELLKAKYFIAIPQPFFSSIEWRGRAMSQVFPNLQNQFLFFEDWNVHARPQEEVASRRKRLRYLIPNRAVLRTAVVEYRRYMKQMLRYYKSRLMLD